MKYENKKTERKSWEFNASKYFSYLNVDFTHSVFRRFVDDFASCVVSNL